MTEDLQRMNAEHLHSAYLDETQKFVVALQAGASAAQLVEIRQKMKVIMQMIQERENEKSSE